MFRLGYQAGGVLRVPYFPTIRVDNTRKGFFERDEFERVCHALPEYLRPLAIVGYWTGWRKSELLGLEWRQVDLDDGTVRLDPGTTKNKDGRLVYLPPEALDVLRAWAERTVRLSRDTEQIIAHVFHRDGARIHDFYAAWRRACKAAGVPGRHFHDLRRTAARNYVRSGVPERVAMSVLGHKTRSIFDRYNITSETDLEEAAKRVRAVSVGAKLGQVHDLASPEDDPGTRKLSGLLGAGAGSRTRTGQSPGDFKSPASTSSATPA